MARKWVIEVDAPGMPLANGPYYLNDRGMYVSVNAAHKFTTRKDALAAARIWGMGGFYVRRSL